ncbi:hypothetical protein [Streptacidiphilus melanogenes]|uniref:hypothetical protein n=1 Tax=Streptacidiphilus melanogenes TaxID=411235 RepID=UPI0005A83973|nr:hypothetical protein [Streptacidiphilus melanogenes]
MISRSDNPGPSGRRRRGGRPVRAGDLMRSALALPARAGLRWLVILVVMVAAMSAYGRVLTTAPPMPPSQAPTHTATPGNGATPSNGTVTSMIR